MPSRNKRVTVVGILHQHHGFFPHAKKAQQNHNNRSQQPRFHGLRSKYETEAGESIHDWRKSAKRGQRAEHNDLQSDMVGYSRCDVMMQTTQREHCVQR